MQRIKIYENDNTSVGMKSTLGIGAVLIPGFASAGGEAERMKLIKCTSVSDFKTLFGKKPPLLINNYFPYSGDGYTIKITGTTKTALELELVTNITAFSAETSYIVKAKCIKDNALWEALTNIEAGPWNIDQWNLVLATNDYVKAAAEGENGVIYQYNIRSNVGSLTEKLHLLPGFPKVAIPEDPSTHSVENIQMVPEINGVAYDPSWLMAYHLINIGFPVYYVRLNKVVEDGDEAYDVSPANAYKYMHEELFNVEEEDDLYSEILDKTLNIEFITSGGYPVLEHTYNIAELMRTIASTTPFPNLDDSEGRGDCVALLDHTNNPLRKLIGSTSIFESSSIIASSYASVFTPWCNVNLDTLTLVPASFIYLYTLGSKGTSTHAWDIFAGISNGRCNIIKSLNTNDTLSNKIAEKYLNDYTLSEGTIHCSINPITYIRNFGYCIWGDRTCEKYMSGNTGFALSFLHVRNLVSEVKKKAYEVSLELMFQTNNELLWTNFKLKMETLLETMLANNALVGYNFLNNASADDKSLLTASIILYPSYGLEKVELSVNLENDATLTVSET